MTVKILLFVLIIQLYATGNMHIIFYRKATALKMVLLSLLQHNGSVSFLLLSNTNFSIITTNYEAFIRSATPLVFQTAANLARKRLQRRLFHLQQRHVFFSLDSSQLIEKLSVVQVMLTRLDRCYVDQGGTTALAVNCYMLIHLFYYT